MKTWLIVLCLLPLPVVFAHIPADSAHYGVFSFSHKLVLPAPPEDVYDAATGDIRAWWDHTFSQNPIKLYIEARPGGGFYEIFNESGEGVLHATVTAAERGKLLRFVGPLGLAGHAIDLVCTYTMTEAGTDSTHFRLDVHAAGEMYTGWAETVEKVWRHFIDDQFKVYIESGDYLKRK